MSFRPYNIAVSGQVFQALRALAATRGIDCPDALGDAMLAERLAQEPEAEWRRKAFMKAMKDIDDEARAKFGAAHPPRQTRYEKER